MPKLPHDVAQIVCTVILAAPSVEEGVESIVGILHQWGLDLMKWGGATSICSRHQYGEDPECDACHPKPPKCGYCEKYHDPGLICREYARFQKMRNITDVDRIIEESMKDKAELQRYMNGGITTDDRRPSFTPRPMPLTMDCCEHGKKMGDCLDMGCPHYVHTVGAEDDKAWRRSHGGHGRNCDCDTCRYNQW
jgi:hypothetical protein